MKQLVKRLVPRRLVRITQVGSELDAIRADVAEIRRLAEAQNHALMSLNHAVVHGGEAGLPLLLDVVQRIRSDADAVIGATSANARVLAKAIQRLEQAADDLRQVSSPLADKHG